MTRWLSLLSLSACFGELGGSTEACDLAASHQTCPECSSGPTTCSFGDTSVTENSCGDCQARSALYSELCDQGETASTDQIEAETVCEPTACEVFYDGCADPCQPTCVPADAIPETTCDLGCPTVEPPPGECTWTGSECGFVIATP
jgi:hypothetical protein